MIKGVIGIDPGANGGITFMPLNELKVFDPHKCHEQISGRYMSVSLALASFKNHELVAYIEKVHAMPHDGRSSLFKFGVNYGVWMGILAAKGIKTVEVSPQKWMKFYESQIEEKLPKIKKDRKNKLKEIAARYYDGKVTLWNADAILITMYGRCMETYKEMERRYK